MRCRKQAAQQHLKIAFFFMEQKEKIVGYQSFESSCRHVPSRPPLNFTRISLSTNFESWLSTLAFFWLAIGIK